MLATSSNGRRMPALSLRLLSIRYNGRLQAPPRGTGGPPGGDLPRREASSVSRERRFADTRVASPASFPNCGRSNRCHETSGIAARERPGRKVLPGRRCPSTSMALSGCLSVSVTADPG